MAVFCRHSPLLFAIIIDLIIIKEHTRKLLRITIVRR